jgi:hypothetical protein
MKARAKIIVEINGGTLVGVYTDVAGARVQLVDWDNIAVGGAVLEEIKTEKLATIEMLLAEQEERRP